ncbi:MAG: hypothetical protein JNG88_04740 [Phycisphaerales bacterium]|nr:hypothetical protein [Phycisphaerales bacterium]
MRRFIRSLVIVAAGAAAGAFAQQQPFTYQGQLKNGANPFNGTANMTFRLFDAATGGTMIDQEVINNVSVSNGLFTVTLGNTEEYRFYGAFSDAPTWLEITVNGTTLSPRQFITYAPKAQYAERAASLDVPVYLSDTTDAAPVAAFINYGNNHGASAATYSTTYGAGITGQAFGSGPSYGGAFSANHSAAAGMIATNNATDGTPIAGVMITNAPSGYACMGRSLYTGPANGSFAGYFDNFASTGFATGVAGYSASNNNGFGVRGHQGATSGFGAGVYGLSSSLQGFGGYFENNNGGVALRAYGLAQVSVLEIFGGADIAEPFDVNADSAESLPNIKPGMVVSIDPACVGELRLATTAFDTTVAGIISGANGVNPGMVLTQKGSAADGKHAVAMTGRVWCYCDADASGAIQAGDLLTTSNTPGHAMRVSSGDQAGGATIGKAMSSLESGKGLVLVLVNLQ